MRLVTICTEDWIDKHLVRWVRYARKNMPQAELYLFYSGSETGLLHPVMKFFKAIRNYGLGLERRWFNEIRMKACGEFKVDEILYCDADADILRDVTDIQRVLDRPLLCVRSPAEHGDWQEICIRNKWPLGKEVNNGLLYMRRDFHKEYAEAEKEVAKYVAADRIRGTIVFNLMVHLHPELVGVVPYEYSTIWWDAKGLPGAKIVQYCSDKGQAKRMMLEQIHRAAYAGGLDL